MPSLRDVRDATTRIFVEEGDDGDDFERSGFLTVKYE